MTPKYKIGDVVVTINSVCLITGIQQGYKQERTPSGVKITKEVELTYSTNGHYLTEEDIVGTIEVKKV